MPNGKELGMHSLGPYPIINWINEDVEEYKIQLSVDENELWEIDEISLKPIVVRWRLKTSMGLIFGAVISAIFGLALFLFWEFMSG